MHTITGGSDAEQRRDGDYLTKDERYARTDEYLDILSSAWTPGRAVRPRGRVLPVRGLPREVKPVQQPRIPLYFGGSSEAAYRVGGKHADTFALWGEPLAETAEQIASVRAAAAAAGRIDPPGISVSFRPILGATEELAWERAERILDDQERAPAAFWRPRRRPVADAGAGPAERRLAAAARRRRRRATGTTARCGPPRPRPPAPRGNSTALVGTPETVAQALLDYVDIGVTTLLIRGYDPLDDAIDYGRHLLPLVRAELARRERQPATAAAV